MRASTPRPSILRSALLWWRASAARNGYLSASTQLLKLLAEFLRDSTPQRRRQRYGDIDYDWDFRVDTTSAAVGWRDRLLGIFNSPYQPTEPALFHEMMTFLSSQPGFDFHNFTFIDLGSGKGRTLLMASDYPFRRIIGIELLPALIGSPREISRNTTATSKNAFFWKPSARTQQNSHSLPNLPCSISSTLFPRAGCNAHSQTCSAL